MVTNAAEAELDARIFMAAADLDRRQADYGDGSVHIHETEPWDRSQSYIPRGNPVVSKLASIGLTLAKNQSFDVVFSFYLEPYAVAGHMVSQALNLPHVVRTAGSDAGRLWKQPQLKPLYDLVFRAAAFVWTGRSTVQQLAAAGMEKDRLRGGAAFAIPEEIFSPEGPALDVAALTQEISDDAEFAPTQMGTFKPGIRYFGIYGKPRENKGLHDLLQALGRLSGSPTDFGLLIMGQMAARERPGFDALVNELGIAGQIVQIPFLPHWRVPEFIRRCVAVCCLERDFPIKIHRPVIAREVMLCGGCLVGSAEIIRKLPSPERLIDGYNCVAIEDVHNHDDLAARLGAILDEPERGAEIGKRARDYALDQQRDWRGAQVLEGILAEACGQKDHSSVKPPGAKMDWGDVLLGALPEEKKQTVQKAVNSAPGTLARIEEIHTGLKALADAGDKASIPIMEAAALDLYIKTAENEFSAKAGTAADDPLFRLEFDGWALRNADIGALVPRQFGAIECYPFEYDATDLLEARARGKLPADLKSGPTNLVILNQSGAEAIRIFVIDDFSAGILKLCAGQFPVSAIAGQLDDHRNPDRNLETGIVEVVESLLATGLIKLGK